MSFVATAIGLGAVGSTVAAFNAAEQQEDQFNAANARSQMGINELLRLRDAQANDPLIGQSRALVANRLANPGALDERTVAMMKANNASDQNRAFTGATNAIRSRAAASGSGRSGTTVSAQNRAAQTLGAGIAQGNRQIDIQAALSRFEGEQRAMAMLSALLGMEQQPSRDIANAYQGLGAQMAQQPSPWSNFWQQTATGFGSAATGVASQLQQQQDRAQQMAMLDRILAGGGGGSQLV